MTLDHACRSTLVCVLALALLPGTLAGGGKAWYPRPGTNCFKQGSDDIKGGSPFSNSATEDECKEACDRHQPDCEAIITVQGQDSGPCWLRKNIQIRNCDKDPGYNLVQYLPDSPKPPPGAWESLGKNTVCRIYGDDKTENGQGGVLVYGANSLAACKGLCGLSGECYGVEYMANSTRCEVWTRHIDYVKSREGYECLTYQPPDFLRGSGDDDGAAKPRSLLLSRYPRFV